MTSPILFPSLEGFEPTRRTLQLYARAITAIPRAYAEPHPKWWHVSLKAVEKGLVTEPALLPGGGVIRLKMDLADHQIVLYRNDAPHRTWDMRAGVSASALGDQIIAEVEGLGLQGGDYARDKFADDDPREYDAAKASAFLTALSNADRIFKAHRATLEGEVSPVQLWPHGFDLAFEWYGDRVQTYEEHGEVTEYPSQLNLGFYPAEPAYFYSNPWPFEAGALLSQALPAGASWHTEGWQGAMLPYAALENDPDAEARLRAFARRVFELASPTLRADWAPAART